MMFYLLICNNLHQYWLKLLSAHRNRFRHNCQIKLKEEYCRFPTNQRYTYRQPDEKKDTPIFKKKKNIFEMIYPVKSSIFFHRHYKIILFSMFFPEHGIQHRFEDPARVVYVYENGKSDQRPIEVKLVRKHTTFKQIGRTLKFNNLRLYNSDGSEFFQEDLDFIKNKSVLYASKGEEFDPGSCFAEYQMIKLLGQGGFGRVYLARHKQTNQNFAIKIIKTENIGSVSDIDSIFVEAEILKSLKHPNIVKVHKCLTLRNMQVVIIMEYLQGGEVFKYLQSVKKFDEDTAKCFIRQIVKGMLYCHKSNLTHRDLKLENLLLVNSEEKKIKIIDFGIAGAISSMKWEDLDTGSLGYMAPECFVTQKNHRFDGRIDVWSTGVILYAMLFGELPFKGNSVQETIQVIKQGKLRLSASIAKQFSVECIDVLRKCLDVNPKTRITMQQLDDHPWISTNMFYSPPKNAALQECSLLDDDLINEQEQKLHQIINRSPPRQVHKNPAKSSYKSSPLTPGRLKMSVIREKEKEKEKKRFK